MSSWYGHSYIYERERERGKYRVPTHCKPIISGCGSTFGAESSIFKLETCLELDTHANLFICGQLVEVM